MNNNNSKIFKHSLLAFAVMGVLGSTAYAEEEKSTNEKDEGSIERIVVTASKRAKGLQESPVAITVVSSKAIEQAKVMDITDLQTLVPTLRVTPLQRSTNTNFAIRGFGNGTNNTGIEPSVGVFIDGVYRSRAASQIGDLPRLQQIEVLSGPQSTLFGKNASAGVISVTTREPSYEQEGKIEVGVGNYNQQEIKGYYTNGITDNLAFSFSGGVNTRDGYTESVVGLNDVNDRDRWNVRGQALYQPTEDIKFRFIADYSKIQEACCSVEDAINGPTTAAVRALGGIVIDENDSFSYQSALNSDPDNNVKDGGVSLQIDIDFDGYSFTSISALRKNDSDFINDVDYTSLDILNEGGYTDIKTITQEFRLTSTGERDLEWMFGAYVFNEEVITGDTLYYGNDIRNYFDVLMAAGGAPGLLGGVEGVYGLEPGTFFSNDAAVSSEFDQQNDAYSLFASFDYHITDDFTAIFGVSYTNDKKDVTISQNHTDVLSALDLDTVPTLFGVPIGSIPQLAPAVPVIKSLQFLPPMLGLPNAVENHESDDSKTTWSLRLAYEINDNINVFATAATGFKATSWNLSRYSSPFASDKEALESAGLALPNQVYGGRYASPEEAMVYEIGIKTQFENGSFSATLFDQTIEGFQSSIFIGTGYVLANAGQQSTQGLEFDSIYNLTQDWSFTLAGTFLDPVYDSFEGASGLDGPVDLSGEKPAGIHEVSITAGIVYNFEVFTSADGYVRTDYIYESDVKLAENTPESLTREVNSFNASAGLAFDNGVNLQLWVRNLTNDEYLLSAFPPPIQAGSFNGYPNQPRTFGANISYQF
ncbi:MAG: TonB-dependent receptor [Shewanella psychromarinicola]|uniref:TonB-dependent receptor n=1 Tax=Shewanella TaxID=22 RepID=UPI000C342C9C|nr:TonB-dependent receptor [Shewanella sp. Actino-trap-3]PKG77502.1 TonB-dependent receptor [Shewanella sp. Actino-trap-3]|tara:strand:- start:57240 stop:59690 length:2451 start_codon:yes stop_codon:yes gene_type:complete